MRYTLIILLFIPFALEAQFGNPDTVDHPSFGEYFNLVYKASTHQAYNILSVVPQLMTNQPTYVTEIYGGPHDYGCTDPSGGAWIGGSVFNPSLGSFQHVTTDSAGNTLPFVTQMLFTGTNTSPFWTDFIVTTDSTTGRQVGMAGQLSGGMHGNGVNSTVNQTSFVWATFPTGTHIVKIVGLYGIWALDSKGHVWTWGFSNNKAELQRGTSPTVSYLLPDTIVLPTGHHAVDIADAGGFGVILLENGHVLGGGDHPKYWGGSGASSSNTPQDFTTFLTTSAGLAPGTGNTFVPAKVFCNSGAIYFIGTDSSLVSSGDNICGQIGNGQMFPMNNYAVSPPPNGSSPQPYAYDNGYEEDLVPAPVRIFPGAHNWVCGYMGPSNCWNYNFINNKNEIWVGGRGKSGQIMDNRASCNFILGGLNGGFPDMVNQPYGVKALPFAITSGTLVTPTCFYCIANPGAANCSQGTACYNGSLSAPIVNGNKQSIASTLTTATLTPSITYASGSKEYSNIVTFFSGPNAPIMPFNTGSTISVSGLTTGTYIFKDSSTDVMWKTGISYDTVVVGTTGIGPIFPGQPVPVVSIDTSVRHDFLVADANYYVLDTLSLPINSMGTFELFFFAYDTVRHYTRSGQQTVTIARIGTVYQAPYSMFTGGNNGTGQSTEMLNFVVTLVNGLPLVRVDGFPNSLIKWHVIKDQKITPL